MDTLFYQLVLSLPAILRQYLKGELAEPELISRLIFVESWRINPDLPDYIHKNYREKSFHNHKSVSGFLLDSYKALTDKYLYFRKQRIWVHASEFESWQNMLTRISPLPLISFAIYKSWYTPGQNIEKILIKNLEKSTLPSIYHPFLTTMIENKGLNELHIHLNGTTELDRVWQDALRSPFGLYQCIKKSANTELVREQYLQIDDYIDESKLYRMLHIARVLRTLMIRDMFYKKGIDHSKLIKTLNTEYLYTDNYLELESHCVHPIKKIFPSISKQNDLVCEAFFLIHAFSYLEGKETGLFAHCMYCYLLILAYFNKLLVQQLAQCGFDQFQKITVNELREMSEQSYENRYKQLEGVSGKDLAFLEGRFSPKETPIKNYKLLRNIIRGFKRYQAGNFADDETVCKKQMRLKLIAHFIKEKEKKTFYMCRHYHLRNKNSKRARALLTLLREKPEFREYVVGIDAAANELHAPPEVYAPVFRTFERNGFTNFTFHAGEDYIHLISGIRAVYEAAIFLELNEKNRIGHATALGIPPELWMKKSDRKIVIEKGEWLDNLVFAYMILSEQIEFIQLLNKIRDEIYLRYREIYCDSYGIDIYLLIQAWKMRNLDPLIAFDSTKEKYSSLDRKEWKEWDRIKAKEKENPQAYKIFERYHSESVAGNSKELISVDTGFTDISAISFLQRKTIELLNEKGVAVESMPTSNVRISFYDDYSTHHIFRWLNIGRNSDLPKPLICLCSDDPGIFATNLRNEFSHIYQTLIESYGYSHENAYTVLKQLNENAEVYRFNY
ncbi:MAG: hypothetical protein GY795_45585 [Desulfobacterales bacterium]|nr:hypothetical protein [Desulfobacterales bacterium]